MNLSFADNKLERLASNYAKCQKELGAIRAKLFNKRLDQLKYAPTLEALRFAPGHYHELVGDRKGQWACDLDGPHRLVFEPHENPIPEDGGGRYIWVEIKGVEILEIVNYHGK